VEISGVAVNNPRNVPGVRKKIPTPFTRPRIDLDGGRHVKREWRDVAVHELNKGDTVAGFGTVGGTAEFIKAPEFALAEGETEGEVTWRIRLFNVMGDYQDFPGGHRVFAFAKESGTA
jgi:hypothetical protein